MKKPEIAKQWARHQGLSEGEAADRLDRVVGEILSQVRKGGEAALPGVGKFVLGPDGKVVFDREKRPV